MEREGEVKACHDESIGGTLSLIYGLTVADQS